MPLFEKARIEVYLPDLPRPAYQELLDLLALEFTYTFGGCSVMRGVEGLYLSRLGQMVPDRVNLLFTDADVPFDANLAIVSYYTDCLRAIAFDALNEEAVLVVAYKVHHSIDRDL